MKPITKETAYNAGYDAGINGANEENCSFHFFATPELTNAWSEGNAKGLLDKQNKSTSETITANNK